jgi:hypothetical protein
LMSCNIYCCFFSFLQPGFSSRITGCFF